MPEVPGTWLVLGSSSPIVHSPRGAITGSSGGTRFERCVPCLVINSLARTQLFCLVTNPLTRTQLFCSFAHKHINKLARAPLFFLLQRGRVCFFSCHQNGTSALPHGSFLLSLQWQKVNKLSTTRWLLCENDTKQTKHQRRWYVCKSARKVNKTSPT